MPELTRQETVPISLPYLVHLAETGQLRPGAFSRPPAWNRQQIIDLFDSIFRGYPIGTILVVSQAAPEEDFLLGDIAITAPYDEHAWVIIDGLQRVTAIVNALSSRRGRDTDDLFALFFDPRLQKLVGGAFDGFHLLPLDVAVSRESLTEWLDDHPSQQASEADACWRLFETLSSYTLPMIRLDGEDIRGYAYQIFTRINAAGSSLTESDLARARVARLNESGGGLQRLQIQNERLGFGKLPAELAAECAFAVLDGRSKVAIERPDSATARESFENLPESVRDQTIDNALRVLIPTVQFLRQEASIPHLRLLPQSSTLAVLLRFVSIYGAPAGRSQELLRRWVWRSGAISLGPADLAFSASENDISAATNLLDSLPSPTGFAWHPDPYALTLDRAAGRLNTLALLSVAPSLLIETPGQPELGEIVKSTDVPISSSRILDAWLDNVDSAFCQFLPPDGAGGHRPSLGSSLLHPPAGRNDLWAFVVTASPDSLAKLATHGIDDSALALLRAGEFDQFIRYRNTLLTGTILRYVQSKARWGFRDHGILPNVSGSYEDEYRDEY